MARSQFTLSELVSTKITDADAAQLRIAAKKDKRTVSFLIREAIIRFVDGCLVNKVDGVDHNK